MFDLDTVLKSEGVRKAKDVVDAYLCQAFNFDNPECWDNFVAMWYEAKAPLINLLGGVKHEFFTDDIDNEEYEDGLSKFDEVSEESLMTCKLDDAINIALIDDESLKWQGFCDQCSCSPTNVRSLIDQGIIIKPCPGGIKNVLVAVAQQQGMENLLNNTTDSGMKFSKYLQKKFDIPSDKIRELVNIHLSKLIQNNHAKAESVIVSVDLLDFIILGEAQAHRVHTCLRLDNSNFAAGVISYALDNTTAIAYTLSPDTFRKYGLSLPNKTWRQVVHIDLDNYAACYGRNYPYLSESIAKTTRKLVNYKLYDHALFNGEDVNDCKWIVGAINKVHCHGVGLGYRETGSGEHCEHGHSRYTMLKDIARRPYINYGEGRIYCMSCGGTLDDQRFIVCNDCSNAEPEDYYCESCDERVSDLYACYIDGDQVDRCEYCRDEHFAFCEECNVHVHIEESTYSDYHGWWVCNDCIGSHDYHTCEACGELVHADSMLCDYCDRCAGEYIGTCEDCGEPFAYDTSESREYCSECIDNHLLEEEEAM